MFAPPPVPQLQFHPLVHRLGDLGNSIHSIEIGEEGHGQPIVSGDMVITAEYHPEFAWLAGAKFGRRFGTHLRQVNSGVTRGVEVPKGSEWLFQQQRQLCERLPAQKEQQQEPQQ